MLVKTFKHKSEPRILEIHTDENPISPREWDNLGVMVCAHSRYELGDVQIKDEDDLNEKLQSAIIKLPLFLYDHSGLSISTSTQYPYNDRWDAGKVGYIIVTRDALLKEYSQKRISKKLIEKATSLLVGEVSTYDQYLRGDVYGFIEYKIEKCSLDEEHKEDVNSCWGFYGSDLEQNGIFDGEYKKEDWIEV